MYIVILAGGSGTRFWPLSRKRTPKQLMSVFGGKSMLQRTLERVLPLGPRRILIVTNALQAGETARQAAYIKDVPIDIVEEPVGRNTAPAIGLAAEIIARHDPDGVMVVLPADHYIVDEEGFRRTLLSAREAALNGALVTLGVAPTRPETGYGYIEAEKPLAGDGPFRVSRFVEKPFFEKALEFLTAGNFYWNSGMFVWRADVILDRILSHMPELAASLARVVFTQSDWRLDGLKSQIEAIYPDIASQSIDFGVMEKADNVVVIPSDFGWSDVGSWSALPEVIAADEAGNVVINACEAINLDSRDCLVYGGGKLVATIGVEGLIIVDTQDALLVCSQERAQEVKQVVEELERRGLDNYL